MERRRLSGQGEDDNVQGDYSTSPAAGTIGGSTRGCGSTRSLDSTGHACGSPTSTARGHCG